MKTFISIFRRTSPRTLGQGAQAAIACRSEALTWRRGLAGLWLLWALLGPPLAHAGVSVVGGLVRTHKAQPGETFEGIILVRNHDDRTVAGRVYQTDYRFTADGKNDYALPGTTPRSNAQWYSLGLSRLTLAAGQTVAVNYHGKVPESADLKGTYWSMVMVEMAESAAPDAKEEQDKVALGLRTQIRYAVQIVVEMGETGERRLEVLDKQLVKDGGKRIFQMNVTNTGERLVIPAGWLELFDAQGVSLGKFESGKTRIYPGCSVRHRVDLTEVPPGEYSALAILDNGDSYVVGAQYQLLLQK